MSELQVLLDPLNPGQFYACCGLVELAALVDPAVTSRFETEPGRPRIAWFCLQGVGEDFLAERMEQLRNAQASMVFDENVEASISPATLFLDNQPLELDWWLDEFRTKPTPLKCWAGQVTPRKLFEDLLQSIDLSSSGADLFQRRQLTKSKFGVDPRAAWNARDCGYSPNEHGTDSATFTAVEVLAAVGLQTFRPVIQRKSRMAAYALWTTRLPVSVARTASSVPWDGLPHRSLQFSIGSRGQSYKYFKFAEAAETARKA